MRQTYEVRSDNADSAIEDARAAAERSGWTVVGLASVRRMRWDGCVPYRYVVTLMVVPWKAEPWRR